MFIIYAVDIIICAIPTLYALLGILTFNDVYLSVCISFIDNGFMARDFSYEFNCKLS